MHDTLLKFHTNPVAVIADISKAFHRILLHPDHRKYTKFPWIGNTECTRLLCYQFKVVIFGACCSPYLLQKVLDAHLSSTHLPVCGFNSQSYVDNFFKTYATVEEAISEKPKIEQIMLDAAMPLQGWVSNHSEFNNAFQIEELRLQNMLGVQWNIGDDTFSVILSKKFPV